jgi:DNA-binding CsgD family transcriptional regulator
MFKSYDLYVNEIYKAASDFSLWEGIIENLCSHTESDSSVFLVVNHLYPELTYGEFLINVDPEHRRLYESGHYNKLDKFSMQLGQKNGQIVHSTSALANQPELYLHQEVENDFFRRYGYDYRIGFALPHGENQHICLYLNRDKKSGDFEQVNGTLKLLSLLSPHIQRSMQLSESLCLKDDLMSNLANGFAGNDSGVLFIDEHGEIIFINEMAEQYIKSNPKLLIQNRSIQLKNSKANKMLQNYINQSIKCLHAANPNTGGEMTLGSELPDQSLYLVVSPIKLSHLGCSYFRKARCAIFISHCEKQISYDHHFAAYYGLTSTESSILADFINSPDLAKISVKRSANIQTLRSQMKSIMSKMSVSKQTELVKKVLLGPSRYFLRDVSS